MFYNLGAWLYISLLDIGVPVVHNNFANHTYTQIWQNYGPKLPT